MKYVHLYCMVSLFTSVYLTHTFAKLDCDLIRIPWSYLQFGVLSVNDNNGIRSHKGIPKLLREGTVIEGFVEADDYDFYQLCIQPIHGDFIVRVSMELESLRGNANLYISFDQVWPSVARSDFSSAKLGLDKITLYSDSQYIMRSHEENAPVIPEVLYISIFGREAATYRFIVNLTKEASEEMYKIRGYQ